MFKSLKFNKQIYDEICLRNSFQSNQKHLDLQAHDGIQRIDNINHYKDNSAKSVESIHDII